MFPVSINLPIKCILIYNTPLSFVFTQYCTNIYIIIKYLYIWHTICLTYDIAICLTSRFSSPPLLMWNAYHILIIIIPFQHYNIYIILCTHHTVIILTSCIWSVVMFLFLFTWMTAFLRPVCLCGEWGDAALIELDFFICYKCVVFFFVLTAFLANWKFIFL